MDKKELVKERENGVPLTDSLKQQGMKGPYRYSKEKLLEIKEYPYAKKRPACLSEKYDSEGIWDPEKWHASLYPTSGRSSPSEGTKKDYASDLDRTILKRRIADPRERIKEEDLDVVLSPQRRSFGGGCHVSNISSSRSTGNPLDNKENENIRGLGGQRRIGSGRIIASRAFDRDGRDKDLRDLREGRDRDYKEKRFRREHGDGKRIFGDRRRCDSYTEEEPEWFSAGPTSQSETIELTGFDDKVLLDDPRRPKRWRKRSESLKEEVECNGGVETRVSIAARTEADQEVPQEAVLPEPTPGDFDFNEFFNMEKSVPGLASMIEEVLGEGAVSSSRFSQWFSSNLSKPGSRSSSLRSTPHEELERLAGLEQRIPTPVSQLGNYFAPIQSREENKEANKKVDILEILRKANVDVKPLLSSLTANKEKLKESSQTGVVLSVEEVEAGLKGLKVEPERKLATPFMVEHLEQALTVQKRDSDMTAFNKLVNCMKASGTLPSQQKPIAPHRVIGPPSPDILGDLLGCQNQAPTLLNQRGRSSPLSTFRQPSPSEFFRVKSPIGYPQSAPHLRDQFSGLALSKGHSPIPHPQVINQSQLDMQRGSLEGFPYAQDLHMPGGDVYQPGFGKIQPDLSRDGSRNRQQRISRSPVPGNQQRLNSASPSQASSFTNMLSPSFTPTSVIRKMFESKEKGKDGKENQAAKECPEDGHGLIEDHLSPVSLLENSERGTSPIGMRPSTFPRSACTTPQLNQMRFTKDHDYRPKSAGRKTPTRASPIPGSPFSRPVCPAPLVSHVPFVRSSPPHLPPVVVQRMLAQGMTPQQFHPALVHAGLFPSGVDLSHLQGIPPPLLGQTFYPLPASGHPLLNTRATQMQSSGAPLQHLAVMRQAVLQSPNATAQGPGAQVLLNQQNSTVRGLHQRSGSPVNLSKWFGSDVLQQPLPSMPSKVISVDELELHQ
ncbi:eukaryotic translation initiation factor 4E transporter isoform X3 [Callorhinchus milii]|uniref:eukaryotic translation initiation factor 4E transporter isoform X3 n=1 Tax=Callorhinchus milii TaxID=7868 RepID=UPI001C3FACB4|nr:eukaryotic translation initiation factor 4E transporter isoform X3 [Callorhinchus milii]